MESEKKRTLAAAPVDAASDRLVLKRQRKKLKHAAMQSGDWERCMFRLVRKDRFCNMARINGALFCGNHLPPDADVASNKAGRYKTDRRQRVPCPVDKRHTVYVYDLDKHVLVCNKVKDAAAMTLLPYYVENINSGAHCVRKAGSEPPAAPIADATPEAPPIGADGGEEPKEAAAAAHAGLSANDEQGLLDKLLAVDFPDLSRRVHAAYERCVGEIPLEKLTHACCEALFAEKKDAGAAKNVLRHIEQQASILGHMARVNLLDASSVFVELGAGRGMLSLALAQSFRDSVFVLVDRAHTRGKADRFIEGPDEAPSRKVLRAKIDIRHLNLAGMQEVVDRPVVCMSKHLCGVATDLSLRAVTQTLPRGPGAESAASSAQPAVSALAVSPLFRGLAVALCCHHVCAWEDYVNPEFFEAHGFLAREFPLLTGMSSWATCGMGLEGGAVEHALGISKADRVVLGRKCKRVLDAGRAAYLERYQLSTQLVHYCEEEDSIENCLLLAWRQEATA
ncbi:hypothetical protein PybrP1_008535 [[Pythium] brassicae (nom. inval.)]|nr:hypothetical protein PybrP1_008535 [[Pythium] brassicae (nom. inval.)]